jgi:beta-glucanase (GH16 family)
MKYAYITCMAMLFIASCTEKKEIPIVTPTAPVADLNWRFESTPIWQDDFDGSTTLDQSKWTYETGGTGWGNNESQFYTAGNNANVENGNLIITAKKELVSGKSYSSSRIVSRGKGDFLYGRFEIRAKLPRGRGTWPALWMLPTDNAFGPWPGSGEIDIMEHVGFDQNKIHSSIHCSAYNGSRGNQKSASKIVSGVSDEFHTYRVDWTPYAVRGYIDNDTEPYFEYTNGNAGFTSWPFNKRFYLLMNIAVGGNWGGAQGIDDNIFPQTMTIDYVRVYKMIEQ